MSFHQQPDPVNDLTDRAHIKLGNQQLSMCSISEMYKSLSIKPKIMSIKRLVAKTDRKQSGRLQRTGKRSITADTMVACDGPYSDPDKTTEEGDERSQK